MVLFAVCILVFAPIDKVCTYFLLWQSLSLHDVPQCVCNIPRATIRVDMDMEFYGNHVLFSKRILMWIRLLYLNKMRIKVIVVRMCYGQQVEAERFESHQSFFMKHYLFKCVARVPLGPEVCITTVLLA